VTTEAVEVLLVALSPNAASPLPALSKTKLPKNE
jgi:hypothetical protein